VVDVIDVDLDETADVRTSYEGARRWALLCAGGDVEVLDPRHGQAPDVARGLLRLRRRARARDAVGSESSWIAPPARTRPVSVIIPTKHRPLQLARALAAARAAMTFGDELIVVDNGVPPTSSDLAREWGATFVHEPRRGVAVARNRGAATAQRDIVVFLDDDGEADRSCLDVLVAELDADAEAIAVVGGVLGRDPSSTVGQLFDARYPLFRGWEGRRFVGSTGTTHSPFDIWRVGPGAVMAWRRSSYLEVGGCDPALGEGTPAGGVEDSDLFRRALDAGWVIRYTPNAVLWHSHPTTRRDLRRKMNHYAVASGAHLAKLVLEEGRPTALVYLARQVLWLPGWVRAEVEERAGRRPHLPVTGIVAFPVMTLLGAVRFVRHRRALRHNHTTTA
jgi:GT2 family glycosyltransferase